MIFFHKTTKNKEGNTSKQSAFLSEILTPKRSNLGAAKWTVNCCGAASLGQEAGGGCMSVGNEAGRAGPQTSISVLTHHMEPRVAQRHDPASNDQRVTTIYKVVKVKLLTLTQLC